jgi:hypothetical protein
MVWSLVTAIYAYFYVTSILASPNLEGYEAEWDWQLLFFAIVRLPWLLLVLALVIYFEIRWLKKCPTLRSSGTAQKRAAP